MIQNKRIYENPLSKGTNRLLRIKSIIAPEGPIPVSKSTWWAGVKDGRFPKPIKLSSRVTAWRESDIQALIEQKFGGDLCTS